jgi:hypothetical protein
VEGNFSDGIQVELWIVYGWREHVVVGYGHDVYKGDGCGCTGEEIRFTWDLF